MSWICRISGYTICLCIIRYIHQGITISCQQSLVPWLSEVFFRTSCRPHPQILPMRPFQINIRHISNDVVYDQAETYWWSSLLCIAQWQSFLLTQKSHGFCLVFFCSNSKEGEHSPAFCHPYVLGPWQQLSSHCLRAWSWVKRASELLHNCRCPFGPCCVCFSSLGRSPVGLNGLIRDGLMKCMLWARGFSNAVTAVDCVRLWHCSFSLCGFSAL